MLTMFFLMEDLVYHKLQVVLATLNNIIAKIIETASAVINTTGTLDIMAKMLDCNLEVS